MTDSLQPIKPFMKILVCCTN